MQYVDNGWMDGWMTCCFTSFSTVFQPHQNNVWEILKSCVQWNLVYDRKDPHLKWGSNLGQLDQQPSAYPTELPGLH